MTTSGMGRGERDPKCGQGLKVVLGLLLGLVGALAIPGCVVAAAGAGAGGAAYALGKLVVLVDSPVKEVAAAAEGALKDLDIAVSESRSTALDAEIRGKTAQNDSVAVYVERKTEKSSEITIRIGVFGDEAKSRAILDKIKARL